MVEIGLRHTAPMVTHQKDAYAHGFIMRVYVGPHQIAHYRLNGNACSVRWYHLDYREDGYIEHFPSVDAARAAIEAFWDSLDFLPWDEDGRRERE